MRWSAGRARLAKYTKALSKNLKKNKKKNIWITCCFPCRRCIMYLLFYNDFFITRKSRVAGLLPPKLEFMNLV